MEVCVVFAVEQIFVFAQNIYYIFFEFRDMPYYQTPQKIGLHIVIGVYNSVTCVNNGSCIRYHYRWICLSDSINSFSHYFNFPFNHTSAH